MTPEHAAWIRQHVIPRRVHDSTGEFLLHHCACQYGPSGWCEVGKCDRCAHRTQPEFYAKAAPETHVLAAGDASVLTPVWLIPTACRWRCPCTCHQAGTAEDRGLLFDFTEVRP
ncbi:MAG: DUF6248 family natural product biosynthesis protein [Pseudonocardia sp.]